MIRMTALTIAAAVLASSVTAASANPGSDEAVIRVSYRDLDLASPQGKAVLTSRLHRAADILCFAGKTRELAVLGACRSDVMASVQPAIQLALSGNARTADAGSIALRALR